MLKRHLLFLFFIIIIFIGCSQNNSTNFSSMADSELVEYISNYKNIYDSLGNEEVEQSLVYDVDMDQEMLDMILKSSPECDGLVGFGNYKWVDYSTKSAHVNAFISLDENKIKCTYIRKKFSAK